MSLENAKIIGIQCLLSKAIQQLIQRSHFNCILSAICQFTNVASVTHKNE